MITGAMFMAECLRQEGVTKVFGQCGHTNYALIDACLKLGIEYVSFRHEQQAAHAADAYFRVTHKLAVLNVHISPGMTNALTGVVTAAADCTPMVVIAGNTPSYHHAREPHQGIRFHADASQGDIYRPVCKRVWRVDDAKFLQDVMPRALNVAQTGRPGAVFLDIPMDVFSAHIDPPAHSTTVAPGRQRADRRRARIDRRGRPIARWRAIARHLRGEWRGAFGSGRGTSRPRRVARRTRGDHADGQGPASRESPAGVWHVRDLGHARGQRIDASGRCAAGGGHGLRRGRLQFLAIRVHVCDSSDAPDSDRCRPAGNRQDLPGRDRAGGRCQDRAPPTERTPSVDTGRRRRGASADHTTEHRPSGLAR